MRCLTGLKYNMLATVIDYAPRVDAPGDPVGDAIVGGHFETVQDDVTGAIQQIWIEDAAVAPTPSYGEQAREMIKRLDIPCYVRGFTELGFRSTANTQTFDDGVYRAVEVVQMTFPARYNLGRSQYVTAIRRGSQILWTEEEIGRPTIFEVQGVTPTFDHFGNHVDNIAVLKRAANQ